MPHFHALSGVSGSITDPLQTATPDLRTATPDLRTAATDLKTAPPHLETSVPDLESAPPDLERSPPDPETAPPHLESSVPDLEPAVPHHHDSPHLGNSRMAALGTHRMTRRLGLRPEGARMLPVVKRALREQATGGPLNSLFFSLSSRPAGGRARSLIRARAQASFAPPGEEKKEAKRDAWLALRWFARPKAAELHHRQHSCALRAKGEDQLRRARTHRPALRTHRPDREAGAVVVALRAEIQLRAAAGNVIETPRGNRD